MNRAFLREFLALARDIVIACAVLAVLYGVTVVLFSLEVPK